MINSAKIAALTVTAAFASAGVATAQAFIAPGNVEAASTYVDIDIMNLAYSGYIAAYEYDGDFGRMLGSTVVEAGLNSDTRISFDIPATGVIALVLYQPNSPDGPAWVEVDIETGTVSFP